MFVPIPPVPLPILTSIVLLSGIILFFVLKRVSASSTTGKSPSATHTIPEDLKLPTPVPSGDTITTGFYQLIGVIRSTNLLTSGQKFAVVQAIGDLALNYKTEKKILAFLTELTETDKIAISRTNDYAQSVPRATISFRNKRTGSAIELTIN